MDNFHLSDDIAAAALSQIQSDEGTGKDGLGHVYLDSREIPTIGHGYNLAEPAHQGRLAELGYDVKDVLAGRQEITEAHANQLFNESFAQAVADAHHFVPDLETHPPEVQQVVVNMAFNMGGDKLAGFANLQAALADRDYEAASREMVHSAWYGQVGDRSERLVDLMESAGHGTESQHPTTTEIPLGPQSDNSAPGSMLGDPALGQYSGVLDHTSNAFSITFGQSNGEDAHGGAHAGAAHAETQTNAFAAVWHDVMSGTAQHDNAFAAAFHDNAVGAAHATGSGSEASHNAFAATFGGGTHAESGGHGLQGGHEASHPHDVGHSHAVGNSHDGSGSHGGGSSHDGGGSHGGGGADPGS